MTMENCKYRTGKERDRENLIDDKYIDFYVSDDKHLVVYKEFNSPSVKIEIEVAIKCCPMCGRKL